MSKFRIKLKLQGLELEVEGSREDAPAIAEQLGRQFVGLLQPAAALAAGEREDSTPDRPVSAPAALASVTTAQLNGKKGRKRRNAPRAAAAGNGAAESNDDDNSVIEWEHDAPRWGLPKQSWSTVQKAIWLLYVAGQSSETKELTSGQIVATYSKRFRSAGQILKHNVTRDLRAIAKGRGAKVSTDSGTEPSVWFLTDGGIDYAKTLVAEATGGPAAAPATDGAPPAAE